MILIVCNSDSAVGNEEFKLWSLILSGSQLLEIWIPNIILLSDLFSDRIQCLNLTKERHRFHGLLRSQISQNSLHFIGQKSKTEQMSSEKDKSQDPLFHQVLVKWQNSCF